MIHHRPEWMCEAMHTLCPVHNQTNNLSLFLFWSGTAPIFWIILIIMDIFNVHSPILLYIVYKYNNMHIYENVLYVYTRIYMKWINPLFSNIIITIPVVYAMQIIYGTCTTYLLFVSCPGSIAVYTSMYIYYNNSTFTHTSIRQSSRACQKTTNIYSIHHSLLLLSLFYAM